MTREGLYEKIVVDCDEGQQYIYYKLKDGLNWEDYLTGEEKAYYKKLPQIEQLVIALSVNPIQAIEGKMKNE